MYIYILYIIYIYDIYVYIIYICLYRFIVLQALAGLVHRTKDPDAAAWRAPSGPLATRLGTRTTFWKPWDGSKPMNTMLFGSLGTRLFTYLQASGATRAAQC